MGKVEVEVEGDAVVAGDVAVAVDELVVFVFVSVASTEWILVTVATAFADVTGQSNT